LITAIVVGTILITVFVIVLIQLTKNANKPVTRRERRDFEDSLPHGLMSKLVSRLKNLVPRNDELTEIAILCPTCGIKLVSTAYKISIVRGYILVFQHGEKYILGCKRCALKAAILEFAENLLFGWWCIPWGATTPLALIQNLFTILTPPRNSTLRKVVTLSGLNFNDLVIDSDGSYLGKQTYQDNIFTVLSGAIWADGSLDERELRTASEIAYELLNHNISMSEIRQRLHKRYGSLEIRALSWDERLLLYRAAITVICADNKVIPRELEYLKQLGIQFGFTADFINEILDSLKDDSSNADNEQEQAAKVLGIKQEASLDEIKRAYRQQALRYHPDRVNDKSKTQRAHDMMCEINRAYSILVKGAIEKASQVANRGDTLFELERYEEALRDYNRSLELSPNDPLILANRGDTLFELERYEEALCDYNRSLELEPDNPEIRESQELCLESLMEVKQ